MHNNSKILDLGAGTGKFTKLLLPFFKNIIAIEPVDGMRKKFQTLFPEVQIMFGTAEEIPLESCSVDFVLCAQAFHWFNAPVAIQEIYRILKPNGGLGLLWNVRDESFDWVRRLTEIIDPYEDGAPRYKKMYWKQAFDETNYFSKLNHQSFSYIQDGSIETIVDRIASISFISTLPDKTRQQILSDVRELIATHPQTKNTNIINLPYKTDVYCSQKI